MTEKADPGKVTIERDDIITDMPDNHQSNTYDIRAGISNIEDRAAFLCSLRAIAELNNTRIICFNADMLAGIRHAHVAMFHSVRAYKKGTMVSNTLEMEALLYAAGSRQCSLAASFGIHPGKNNLYVCCYPTSHKVWDELVPLIHIGEDSWSGMTPKKRANLQDLFGITDEEIATTNGYRIVDLVLERIALLEVYR
ncbi:MAG: KEOPS complex subunit Cgi121 [Methanomicrobiales archaeon]